MCLLCDDEKAYQAYMTYLDAMRRQGGEADPDKAMDAVLDAMEQSAKQQPRRDDPAFGDFSCKPGARGRGNAKRRGRAGIRARPRRDRRSIGGSGYFLTGAWQSPQVTGPFFWVMWQPMHWR